MATQPLVSFNFLYSIDFFPSWVQHTSTPLSFSAAGPQLSNMLFIPHHLITTATPGHAASKLFLFTSETFYHTSCFHLMHGCHPPGLCPLHLMSSSPSPFHFQIRTPILFPFKLYYVCQMNATNCNWHQFLRTNTTKKLFCICCFNNWSWSKYINVKK